MDAPEPKDVTTEVVEQVDEAIFSLHEWLFEHYSGNLAEFWLGLGVIFIGTFVVALVALLVTRLIVNSVIYRIVKKNKNRMG